MGHIYNGRKTEAQAYRDAKTPIGALKSPFFH
jgi:hypothetical protein